MGSDDHRGLRRLGGNTKLYVKLLRQFASQNDIAAVGISVNTAGNVAIVEELKNLAAKGVKIVTIDSDVDRQKHRDARFAFLGTDNRIGGRELGKCARGLRPEGGEYVTFVGITGAQNAIERVGGFAEGAGDKFKSLDNMGDDTDRTKARENVRNAINSLPEGMGLNPSAAEGLVFCSDAQFGKGTRAPVSCPSASRIRTSSPRHSHSPSLRAIALPSLRGL